MLSNKTIRRLSIATAISLSLISLRPIKSEANPAALAAPAACATGVGCILVGTAVVGGVLVYIWQNRNTGERYQVRASRVMPSRGRYDANQFAGKNKVPEGQLSLGAGDPVTPDECGRIIRMTGRTHTFFAVSKLGRRNGKNQGYCVEGEHKERPWFIPPR